MYKTAAEDYFKARKTFEDVNFALNELNVSKQELKWVGNALRASVRARFRAISNRLVKNPKFASDKACRNDFGEKIVIDHAVPVNLIHDRILGIMHDGSRDNETYERYRSTDSIETLLACYMIGVFVTQDEHEKINKHHARVMPKGSLWVLENTMARYKTIDKPEVIPYHKVSECQLCQKKWEKSRTGRVAKG